MWRVSESQMRNAGKSEASLALWCEDGQQRLTGGFIEAARYGPITPSLDLVRKRGRLVDRFSHQLEIDFKLTEKH